jgi:hypothetical protein
MHVEWVLLRHKLAKALRLFIVDTTPFSEDEDLEDSEQQN